MKIEDFKTHYTELETKCEEILGLKTGEYSSDADRLWNFKVRAAILGLKPSQVAMCDMTKHVASLAKHTMSETGDWVWQTVAGEGVKQRIADNRNYLSLIYCLLEEERNKPVKAIVPDKNKAFAKYPKTFEEIFNDYLETVKGLRLMNLNPSAVLVDRQTYKTLQDRLKLKQLTIGYEREIPVLIDPVAAGYSLRVIPQPEELLEYTSNLGEGE